jgi:hypothetical protein
MKFKRGVQREFEMNSLRGSEKGVQKELWGKSKRRLRRDL